MKYLVYVIAILVLTIGANAADSVRDISEHRGDRIESIINQATGGK